MTAAMGAHRTDLLELTVDALLALTNPGFVKRAVKEIADGQIPAIEEDPNGTVRARYADGQCATLPPGRALREALCTCHASGLCRHRVTLVLAYQHWANAAANGNHPTMASTVSGQWCPADFDDATLAMALPAATLETARRLAGERPVIRIDGYRADSPVPAAHLPMCSVRFFSRENLLLARCDCQKGSGCEHVALAIWAFRQARAQQPGQPQAMVALQPATESQEARPSQGQPVQWFDPAMASPAPDLDALLLQLWLDGTSQPELALDAKFEGFRHRCIASGWSWVVEALDELRQTIAAQHARSSGFDPSHLLDAMTQLPARLIAARHSESLSAHGAAPQVPPAQILGVGIKGEVALDHLRLVSLGVSCWQDDSAEGAQIAFADPDTQAVTVFARSWPLADTTAAGVTMNRRVAGHTLQHVARAQIVTRGAKRRANGLIEIASGTRQTSILPLSPQAWDALNIPLRQPGGRALLAHLRAMLPDFVRPKQAIEHLHVVPISQVLEWGWSAATQTLHARVTSLADDRAGDSADNSDVGDADIVLLSLPHQAATPGAVDALARALSGEWGAPMAVAGVASIDAGHVRLRPLSLMTAQRAVVLQAEPAARLALPLREIDLETTPLQALIVEIRALLATWLRQGLRHQGAGAIARGRAHADMLARAGLQQSGAMLHALLDTLRARDRSSLPAQIAGLVLLLEDTRRRLDETA